MKKLRIGIIGAGRMGRIRARSAVHHSRCEVAGIADTNLPQAESLAEEVGCGASADWAALIRRDDIDAVVVATPHKYLAPISAAALEEHKHVFCEKPGARTPAEAETMLRVLYDDWQPADTTLFPRIARRGAAKLVIGFTLRHHLAIARARESLAAGEIGKPMYLIGRYGHGGRPGYEQEWRHVPDLAGGGELLDQGIHLIDLSRWFLGEFAEVAGFSGNYFWGSRDAARNGGLEDNAFLLLRSAKGRVASLQASWTQWKNLFSFEVYGENGSLHVQGLGGSYGQEKLLVSRRRAQGGAPDTREIDIRAGRTPASQDDVWTLEWQAFVNEVSSRGNGESRASAAKPASAMDAWEALRIVEASYAASRTASAVPLQRLSNAQFDKVFTAAREAE
jgi:predicted dehydrogenase